MGIACVASLSAIQNANSSQFEYQWAADGTGVLSLMADYRFDQVKLTNNGTSQNNKSQTLDFAVRGANYFGEKDNLGIGYGIVAGKYLSGTTDGVSIDASEIPFSVAAELLFQYKVKFSDPLMLELGVGTKFGFSTKKEGSVRTSRNAWALLGRIDVLYAFPGGFALTAGCMVGVPFSYSTKETGSTSKTVHYSTLGFSVAPMVGGVYCY